MAIFTAQQATTAVIAYTQAQSKSALNSLISEYQQIFDSISLSSAAGANSTDLRLTKYDYNRSKDLLTNNGYTVSDLPEDDILNDDKQVTYPITISWPATTVPRLTGVSPGLFTATIGVSSSINIVPQGGLGPYTWTISGGALPAGLSFVNLSRVNYLAITGTPTGLGTGSFNYTVVDSAGQAYSSNVTWSITASNTLYLGSTAVALNRSSGTLTLNNVNIVGNADTVTNGVYTTGAQTIDGAKTFSSAIIGNLTGNVTGNLTGNVTGNLTGNITGNVSGNAGTVTNGVYTNQSYTNPAWIASLAGSKLTGTVVATDGVITTGSYTDPTWLTITKAKVGLSNVTNESKATMFTDSALTGTTTINQGTLTTVTNTTTSLVNKAYVDRQALFALAVGIWG